MQVYPYGFFAALLPFAAKVLHTPSENTDKLILAIVRFHYSTRGLRPLESFYAEIRHRAKTACAEPSASRRNLHTLRELSTAPHAHDRPPGKRFVP